MNLAVPVFMRFLSALAAAAVLLTVSSCDKKQEPVSPRISLNTEPSGAVVTIRGIERGKTPLHGKMKPGIYLIKFSLPGYRSNWQKIELAPGDRKDLIFQMEPETAAVVITSYPDSAAVNFQGKNIGKTPVVIPDLPHGSYTAELTRPGFNKQTASWTINSPVPKMVKIKMDSNLGILEITSSPQNTEVLLDGKTIGRTPFKDQVEEGRHSVELRRNGYISLKRNVQIKSGETTSLHKLVLEIKPGSIRVDSQPTGARISINSKHYGNTPVKIPNLKPGSYSIQLEKEGFDPIIRTVTLPAGENLDLTLNLDSNTGGADVVTQPPGLTLYLDGKMIGVSEKNPVHKNISEVFKIRNLSMGKHRLTIAHKRARPEKKNFTFTVEKGKIVRLTGLNLWIPNAVIVRDDGSVTTGRIVQDLPLKYEFEPSPGVKYTIEKISVKKVDFLPETES